MSAAEGGGKRASRSTIIKKSGVSGSEDLHSLSMISTNNFTECLETTLRVQNSGGKFQGGIIGRISRLGQLILFNQSQFWEENLTNIF